MPSIGDIFAFEILAELGPITRFTTLKQAQNYAELVPTLVESGGKEKKENLQKRSNRRLRTTLFLCARTLVTMTTLNPEFRAYITKVVKKHTSATNKVIFTKSLGRIGQKIITHLYCSFKIRKIF